MGVRLEGKPVVANLRDDIKSRVAELRRKGVSPHLLIIRVGQREDDISYERSIIKNCDMLGVKRTVRELPADISQEDLIQEIRVANQNPSFHGIMIFRPLPALLDADVLARIIDPGKDIDCMSPENLENIFKGHSAGFVPCTPKAVVELLKYYQIPLKGAHIVVAGRSLVVGKPLAMLLLDEHATITICHSRTRNMPAITSKADIVIAAIGKAKFMTKEYFSHDSIVIDVGINDDGNGKICGDVDYERVVDLVQSISPAIGGIGTITTTILLQQTVQACESIVSSS